LLHSGNGLILAHGRYFSLIQANTRDKQTDEIGWQCLRRQLGRSSAGLDAVLYARPEGRLVDI
jgi:hypothetical protein